MVHNVVWGLAVAAELAAVGAWVRARQVRGIDHDDGESRMLASKLLALPYRLAVAAVAAALVGGLLQIVLEHRRLQAIDVEFGFPPEPLSWLTVRTGLVLIAAFVPLPAVVAWWIRKRRGSLVAA